MENFRSLVESDSAILNERCNIFNFNGQESIDPKDLKNELIESMIHYNGIGLSSNQIGYPYKVFSMYHEDEPMIIFNPRVIQESEQNVLMEEGCLSYPGFFVKIKRPLSVAVSWYDENGDKFEGWFSELSGRIFQHEMDHMLGNTFYDTASSFHMKQAKQKRKIYRRRMKGHSG